MSDTKGKRRVIVGAVLSGVGFLLSAYLTHLYYEIRSGNAHFRSLCNVGDKMNCDAVAASAYAEFFMGLPLSSMTAAWYVAVAILFLMARSRQYRDDALRVLGVLTVIASVMSIFYIWVLSSVLQTFCIMCLAIDAINFASLAIVLSMRPPSIAVRPIQFGNFKTFAGIFAVSFFVVILMFKGMDKSEIEPAIERELVNRYFSEPVKEIAVSPDHPSIGNPNAPFTIVEFSDFQCPYCKKGATILNSVVSRYQKQVRIVFKNYPLDSACNSKMKSSGHAFACEAARVAHCAHKQGRFEDVYEVLFERQEALKSGLPLQWAIEKGLNEAQLKACLDSAEPALKVQESLAEGDRLGVTGTPTFFLNGKKVEGGAPLQVWFQILDTLVKNSASK